MIAKWGTIERDVFKPLGHFFLVYFFIINKIMKLSSIKTNFGTLGCNTNSLTRALLRTSWWTREHSTLLVIINGLQFTHKKTSLIHDWLNGNAKAICFYFYFPWCLIHIFRKYGSVYLTVLFEKTCTSSYKNRTKWLRDIKWHNGI